MEFLGGCSVNATFQKDVMKTLWLIGEIWVIGREYHWLENLDTIFQKPSISHLGLSTSQVHIHLRSNKSIFSICRVTLRIINHEKSLIPWAMNCFEGWNNLGLELGSFLIRTWTWTSAVVDNSMYLIHKEFTCPVAIIILSIFE